LFNYLNKLQILFSLGKCSGRILICTRIVTRVPAHQDRPKQTTRHVSRVPFGATLSRSRGHSFWGHRHPENSHASSTSQLFPRPLLLLRARHLQQSTSLIFTFNSASKTSLIHGVSYAVISSHVLNIATALAPAQTITDGSRNHF